VLLLCNLLIFRNRCLRDGKRKSGVRDSTTTDCSRLENRITRPVETSVKRSVMKRRLYRNQSLNFDLTRNTFTCPCSWRDDRPVPGVVSKGLSFGNKEDVLTITSCEFHIVGRGTNTKLNGIYQGWKCCSLKCPCIP
jgi:hypothetical protein